MLSDTSPGVEQLQIERLRAATPAERMRTTVSMSRLVIRMSRMAMIRLHPDWSDRKLSSEYVRIHYGDEIAGLMTDSFEIER